MNSLASFLQAGHEVPIEQVIPAPPSPKRGVWADEEADLPTPPSGPNQPAGGASSSSTAAAAVPLCGPNRPAGGANADEAVPPPPFPRQHDVADPPPEHILSAQEVLEAARVETPYRPPPGHGGIFRAPPQ